MKFYVTFGYRVEAKDSSEAFDVARRVHAEREANRECIHANVEKVCDCDHSKSYVSRVPRDQEKEKQKMSDESIVKWAVNDNGELGVEVNGVCYFLYKGESIVYKSGINDDGKPMHVRPVFKREFGECCHPLTAVNLNDGGKWRLMTSSWKDESLLKGEYK